MGFRENHLTRAVGWALSESPGLCLTFTRSILGESARPGDTIRLQRFGTVDKGFTDIEIECGTESLIVVEAKRYWDLPGEEQLRRYAERMSPYGTSRFVSMSQWSKDHAEFLLRSIVRDREIRLTNGRPVEVTHRSWADVCSMAQQARKSAANAEKRLLDDLVTYLEFVMNTQNQRSNMVFVVPLGRTATTGGQSTRKLALEDRLYAYPVGKRRLKKVPNYIAFTFDGLLQSIHHVEAAEYSDDALPSKLLHRFGIRFDKPHFVFSLGEAFRPPHHVKSSVQAKQWCLLDTLLTCESLAEAQTIKNARLRREFDDVDEEDS